MGTVEWGGYAAFTTTPMFIGAIIPLAGIPLFCLEEKAQGHEHECPGGCAITAIDAPRALDTLAKLRASKTAPIEVSSGARSPASLDGRRHA